MVKSPYNCTKKLFANTNFVWTSGPTQSIGEKFDVKASVTKKRREDGSNVIYYNMLSLNKTN